MAQIEVLSPHLANLIAAGEVVERPASIAKELIENSIDAGASRIQIELENGGITYLRIMDNGCGMSAEDAPIAFKRHATSKLKTEKQLSAIGTLGFRGEALAAIASVSKIDLFTKQKDEFAGIHLHLEAGEITENEDAGCPDGTTIIVRDLFFNTPARMKFLKKDFTEAGYVISAAEHAALSHPEIAFSIIKDGKQIFATSGDNKLITPVFQVFGSEITSNLVEVPRFSRDNISVWGYITKPHMCRPNRSMQHFFVNGRYIKSKVMQAALEQAYKNQMITGKYPSGAIFIEIPLSLVDVNVHPAKTEVKFAEENRVFEAVYIACKNAIDRQDNVPELKASKKLILEQTEPPKQQVITEVKREFTPIVPEKPKNDPIKSDNELFNIKKTNIRIKQPIIECDDFEDGEIIVSSFDTDKESDKSLVFEYIEPKKEENKQILSENTPKVHEIKQETQPEMHENNHETQPVISEEGERKTAHFIGEAFNTYIVAEDEKGFILLDKHAAHERIIFNKLKKSMKTEVQQLLTPHIAELPTGEFEVLADNLDILENLGFDVSVFGEKSLAVRAVPSYLDAGDITSVLCEISEKLGQSRIPEPEQLDELIHTVSCKAAIKAGKRGTQMELETLLDTVINDNEVTCCPHGRPVMVRLTKYEIDKLFKRVNQ